MTQDNSTQNEAVHQFKSTEYVHATVNTDTRQVTSHFRIQDTKLGIEQTQVRAHFDLSELDDAQLMMGCVKHLQLAIREKIVKPGVLEGQTDFDFKVPADMFRTRRAEVVTVQKIENMYEKLSPAEQEKIRAYLLAKEESEA